MLRPSGWWLGSANTHRLSREAFAAAVLDGLSKAGRSAAAKLEAFADAAGFYRRKLLEGLVGDSRLTLPWPCEQGKVG